MFPHHSRPGESKFENEQLRIVDPFQDISSPACRRISPPQRMGKSLCSLRQVSCSDYLLLTYSPPPIRPLSRFPSTSCTTGWMTALHEEKVLKSLRRLHRVIFPHFIPVPRHFLFIRDIPSLSILDYSRNETAIDQTTSYENEKLIHCQLFV